MKGGWTSKRKLTVQQEHPSQVLHEQVVQWLSPMLSVVWVDDLWKLCLFLFLVVRCSFYAVWFPKKRERGKEEIYIYPILFDPFSFSSLINWGVDAFSWVDTIGYRLHVTDVPHTKPINMHAMHIYANRRSERSHTPPWSWGLTLHQSCHEPGVPHICLQCGQLCRIVSMLPHTRDDWRYESVGWSSRTQEGKRSQRNSGSMICRPQKI